MLQVSAISCLLNVPKMKSFMFRTYNLPPGVYSHYPGNCKHKVWEAIRASSAAPVYLKEFVLGDFIHQVTYSHHTNIKFQNVLEV